MATPPRFKRFAREDFPDAPAWFEPLFLVFNETLGGLVNAVTRNLTRMENLLAGQAMQVRFATPADASWVTMDPLTNAWVASAGFNTPAYKIDRRRVYIRGRVIDGTVSTTTATGKLFTLPVGYRPSATEIFAVQCNDGADKTAQLRVLPTGEVVAYSGMTGAAGRWFSFDGVDFEAVTPATAPTPTPVPVKCELGIRPSHVTVTNLTRVDGQPVAPWAMSWTFDRNSQMQLSFHGLEPSTEYLCNVAYE